MNIVLSSTLVTPPSTGLSHESKTNQLAQEEAEGEGEDEAEGREEDIILVCTYFDISFLMTCQIWS